MAKEKKAPKKKVPKKTAQVKSEGKAALNENESGYPAYGYGPQGYYGYPGFSDYPYPAISQGLVFLGGDSSFYETGHYHHPYCPPYHPYYPPYYRHPYTPYPHPSYPYPC
jgi:hypothetical protein